MIPVTVPGTAKNQKAMGDPPLKISACVCESRPSPFPKEKRHTPYTLAAYPLHFLCTSSRFTHASFIGVPSEFLASSLLHSSLFVLCSDPRRFLAASSGFPRASLFVRPLFDSSRLPRGFLDTSSTVHALQIVTGLSCSDCILKLDPGQQQHTFAQK